MENSFKNEQIAQTNIQKEPFYHNEIVDVFDIERGIGFEAIITSIRGNVFIVKYSSTNEEEVIRNDDKIIIKQWRPGRNFIKYNRVDIKSNRDNCFYQGIVTYVDSEKIKISYKINSDIYEEAYPINSNRISEIGKYTQSKNGRFSNSEQINTYLHKKKIFKSTNNQEDTFREELRKINMAIKDIKEDGNCLYRSISHQIYGNEEFFDVVKSYCMDYLELEKEFFGQFINGGIAKFNEYLELKRRDGVWGDDVEIQAISELYDRPIVIYSYSIEPLKTFHENKDFNRFGIRNENEKNKINISYHGNSHYNSLVPENEKMFIRNLLKSKPGEIEDIAIEKLKILKADLVATSQKKQKKYENSNVNNSASDDTTHINEQHENTQKVENSREDFIIDRKRDIDSIIEERLAEISKKRNKILDENKRNLESAITQSEQMITEEEMLKSIMEISKKENQNDLKNANNQNITPSIQFIIEMGFTFEEAIMALSAVGDDPELMLQFLFSLNHD